MQMERHCMPNNLSSHVLTTILLAEMLEERKRARCTNTVWEPKDQMYNAMFIVQLTNLWFHSSVTSQNAEPALEVPVVQSEASVNQAETPTPVPVSQIANGAGGENEDSPVEVQYGKPFLDTF